MHKALIGLFLIGAFLHLYRNNDLTFIFDST